MGDRCHLARERRPRWTVKFCMSLREISGPKKSSQVQMNEKIPAVARAVAGTVIVSCVASM